MNRSRSPAPPSERSKKTSSSQLRQHGGHAIHHPMHRRTGSAGGVGGVVTASGTYQHHTSEAPDDSVVNVSSGLMGVPNVMLTSASQHEFPADVSSSRVSGTGSPLRQGPGRLSVGTTGGVTSVSSPSSVATSRSTLALASSTTPVNSVVGSPHMSDRGRLPPSLGHDHTDGGGNVSLTGNSIFYGESDGSMIKMSESQKAEVAQVEAKMRRVQQKIKEETVRQEESLQEYLKLHSNAKTEEHKTRIKQLFENKHQKSGKDIKKLQKKFDEYDRRKREIEGQLELGAMGGAGQKVKDGIKQVFGTATRPVEKLAHLVGAGQAAAGRHTTAFGSADNLSSLSSNESLSRSGAGHHHPHRPGSHTGSASLPRDMQPRDSLRSVGSGGGGHLNQFAAKLTNKRKSSQPRRKCLSDDGRNKDPSRKSTPSEPSDAASETSPSLPASSAHPSGSGAGGGVTTQLNLGAAGSPHHNVSGVEGGRDTSETIGPSAAESYAHAQAIADELREAREEVDGLREGMDEIKRELSEEIRNLESALREEVEQRQRLEGMLDDQQQLHQAKMEDLKSQVEMQEEQAVYQIRDNSKTMGESLKMLEMRVLKLEEKRLEEYPQFGEGFSPGGDSRALLMKLLTAAIAFVQIVFLIAGFLINTVAPFVRTIPRLFSTCLLVGAIACYYHKQEDVLDFIQKLKLRYNFGNKNS